MNSFNNFNNLPLAPAVKALFDELNIPLNSTVNEAIKPQDILEDYYKPNDEAQSLINDVYFLGMVDDQAFNQQSMLFGSQEWTAAQAKNLNSDYDGLVVLAVALKARPNSLLPTRGQLADISRVFNRAFSSTPVTIVFKYDEYIALANSERISKKNNDGEKIGKVSLLKDISLNKTHTGHTRILTELAITSAGTKAVTTFAGLYKHWQSVLSVSTLNKQFYQKLFNWYLWALPQAKFPQIRPESDMIPDEQHQSESLIRLLTRLLFVWFMKEKGLINSQLFDRQDLKSVLNQDFFANDGQNTIYYKAVLQNLFFATLNKPIQQRKAIDKGFNPKEYGDALIYRFAELFKNEASFLSHFDNIPFLNGGLFDCLDKRKDNTNLIEIRLDGFSTQKKKQAVLPDALFFGEYKDVDLSSAYDDKKKKKETVYGLVDILHQYKFTIEENTPQDEEIALDPELLGKVFENLLASYNPETKTTARKQTGSFYTPREIVDYMVDESLIAYFLAHLHDASEEENRSRLQKLLDYSYHYDTHHHLFNDDERTVIILKLNDLTLLDPACGSGAFPMGALNKLVLMLKRLDPNNALWKRQNKLRLTQDLKRAEKAKNPVAIAHTKAELQKLELSFSEASQDYPRKLYLIERCIYGIDIQPIATQIAKLRFFISLLVDQSDKPNQANRGFEPLPNLDFKLVTANTLVAAPETHNADDMFASVQDDFFEQLEQKTYEYFNTHTPQEKEHKKQAIEKLIDQKCAEKKQEIESFFNNKNPATQKALKAKYKDVIAQKESDLLLWESYKNVFKHEAVGFFDIKYFFPQVKEGFDVVIGNPPYVLVQNLDVSTTLKNYYNSFDVAQYKTDLYHLFIEKSVFLSNKSTGLVSFITPNTFIKNKHDNKLREFIIKNTNVDFIVVFYKQVFESASVDNAIFQISRQKKCDNIRISEIKSDFISDVHCNNKCLSRESIIAPNYTISIDMTSSTHELIEKINKDSVKIKEIGRSYFGIQTFDRDKFVSKEKLSSNYLPVIDGANIKKYHISAHSDFIDFRKENIKSGGNPEVYKKERIVVRQIGNYPSGAIIKENIYTLNTIYNIFFNDNRLSLRYILSIINSTLIKFYWGILFYDNKATFPKIKKDGIEAIPIKVITEAQQKPFITLVEQIMHLKQQGQPTIALETQIDNMVYALYGLTDQEIAIIEGK
jgi:adenine-specific DNA-methyltransferase